MRINQLRKLQTVTICKKEGRYVSFPDVVKFPEGKLLCVFRDADIHYPPTAAETELLLVDSFDGGLTWGNERVFSHYPRDHDKWAWHCARLSLLSDGRVALLCDLAGPGYGEPVVHLSLSEDEGLTWSTPIDTGIVGIVPDRLIEFSPTEWGVSVHWARPEDRDKQLPFSQRLYATEDAGRTWALRGIVGEDDYRAFCEASIIKHPDGRLIAYMRENSFLHQPTYVSFSNDKGRTWSPPDYHPTFGHRHSAGLLDRETLLLTYRNVVGNPGLQAWVGGVSEVGYQVGGKDLSHLSLSQGEDGLRVLIQDVKRDGVEWPLFPLVSWEGSFHLQAVVRRVWGDKNTCVLRGAGVLRLLEKGISLSVRKGGDSACEEELRYFDIDTSIFHRYELRYELRKLSLLVDGVLCFSSELPETKLYWERKVAFGNLLDDPPNEVSFSRHEGESIWQEVSFSCHQPVGEAVDWSWTSSTGKLPNAYEKSRTLQIDDEQSMVWAESGYSGWVHLTGSTFYCVDYRRGTEEKPYVVGHLLEWSPERR
jgi:sialidase-1